MAHRKNPPVIVLRKLRGYSEQLVPMATARAAIGISPDEHRRWMRTGEEILLRQPDEETDEGRTIVAGSENPCAEYVRIHRTADASALGRLAAKRGGIALNDGHPQQLRAIETHLDWIERKNQDADQEAGGLGLSAADLAALKPATRAQVLALAGEAAKLKAAVLELIARDRAEQDSSGASDPSVV